MSFGYHGSEIRIQFHPSLERAQEFLSMWEELKEYLAKMYRANLNIAIEKPLNPQMPDGNLFILRFFRSEEEVKEILQEIEQQRTKILESHNVQNIPLTFCVATALSTQLIDIIGYYSSEE